MIMPAAIRIKQSITERAVIIAGQVFIDRHFIITNTAKNGPAVKFIFLPYFVFMTRFFLMTIITGIIFSATFELYGNDIK